jgi:capsule polysaccharide export protein KpsE/RkpR
MTVHGVKQGPAQPDREILEPSIEQQLEDTREWQAELLRGVWNRRGLILRATTIGLVVSTLFAFLLPRSFTSTTQLMPPDPQSASGLAMMVGLASKNGNSLGSMAGDLLAAKSTGALFIGVLRSETSEDRLVQQFDLRKVYGERFVVDARAILDDRTSISEDRKSGIITISVVDRSPQRAAALANAYVDELNSLVAELSTSAAHRERVFLEERLKVVKQDLDDASNQLAQFSSKNSTLDPKEEGRAMLDAAAHLAGEMIAAQSELEGLRQIYTDTNPRVRSLSARVAELRRELQKVGGMKGDVAKDGGQSGAPSEDMPYPSIRSLPLLGAKYTDYYRHVRIQETVYELLTEQTELAKVEEAKETPSVKILDPGKIPEKKSSPHRLLLMVLGPFLGFASSMIWVFGVMIWNESDPHDPRKILAEEIVATVKAYTPRISQNGSGPGSPGQKIWGPARQPPADKRGG